MRIGELPVTDVREPLTAQRERLLGLLASLSAAQWAAPTAAPEWSVKDVALHLLGVDLSWLARDRDDETAGIIAVPDAHEEFVRELGRLNQRWVDGGRMLSPRLVTDQLRWSGEQLDAHLGTVDLARPSSVYWAGQAPLWFDLAREFTERWVHYQQIRAAAWPSSEGDGQRDEFLPLVLRTFLWGFPHQYRAAASSGTVVALEIDGVGTWTLTSAPDGWVLDEGQAIAPAAGLRATGDAAWRLLTGARYDTSQVLLSGDPALTGPLLAVRGIIV